MIRQTAIGITVLAALAAAAVAEQKAPASSAMAMQKDGSYLGIGVQDMDAGRAKALKLKDQRGAEISTVDSDGPAAKGGLKPGDVVLEYNGAAVQNTEQLQRLVRETAAGRTVKMTVWRNGASKTLSATVGQRKGAVVDAWSNELNLAMAAAVPLPPMPPMPMPRVITIMPAALLGIDGEALNQEPQFADFMGVKDGVLVKSVDRRSAAEKAGIKAGDVIVKVDDRHVSSSNDITAALRALRAKRTCTLTLVRAKREMPLTVAIELP